MFIGHFALALAGSRVVPRLRLGTAFLAAQLPDVLWPCFLLAGVERATIVPGDTVVTPLRFDDYPWSHSLVMVGVWGAALGLLLRWRGSGTRAGILAGCLALSHWLLDFVTHRKDLPLVPWGGPRLGLELWRSRELTMLVETALFACAVSYYASGRRVGKGFWALVATLLVLYLANLFGPPPPNMGAVAGSGIVLFPLVWLWANNVERRVVP